LTETNDPHGTLMQRLPLSYVRPGMTLAKPAVSPGHVALLAEGSLLTAPLLEWLASHEVRCACVEGRPVDLAPEVPEAAERLAELDALFARHTDAWMLGLKAMFADHALLKAVMRRLAGEETTPGCEP
jgi:hypothetical protein